MSKDDKLWGGRFQKEMDEKVEQFTESVSFDKRLYRQDIRGSIAHAQMLARCGFLSDSELVQVRSALEEIQEEIEGGTFEFDTAHEDVHMNIEAALIDRIGQPGMKLHTARSRNDQVACDLRLWVREAIDRTGHLLEHCQAALVDRAEVFDDAVLPGCTHLQHAQPVLLSHLLLAYVEMLHRDRMRLDDCRERTNVSPLGAGALAGSTLPVEPDFTAQQLGFNEHFRNSVDAVSDRDFAVEYVFCLSTISMHLSRLAEEWLLWATPEYDFIDIDESFCTGSSIMPQKKNPDVLELIRGKTGRVYGHLTHLLTLMKGQPLAYNRDLQEDKQAVFDASDQLQGCLSMLAAMIPRTTFKEDNMERAAARGHVDATALAEYLVGRGMAFREAHRIVGAAVHEAASRDKNLQELGLDELRQFSEIIGEDVYEVLGSRTCLQNYRTPGSSSPDLVREQVEDWKDRVDMSEIRK
ncbi:MAG: argininosuccinate lyase [Planctomycetota bacterium]